MEKILSSHNIWHCWKWSFTMKKITCKPPICRCTVNLAYMNLNQCKTTRNSATSSGFFTFMHFEWRPAGRRARNVVPICFIAGKFPGEVKGLGQGYMEVKSRNHPPLFAIKKRWPHKTTVAFLKKSLRPYRWEWLFAGCLSHLGSTPIWGEGIVVFVVLPPWEGVLHLPSARWLCPRTEQPGAKQTRSRCPWYVVRQTPGQPVHARGAFDKRARVQGREAEVVGEPQKEFGPCTPRLRP